MPDQAELRHQILRRRGAIGLVLIVERIAERLRGIIENHREMRRRNPYRGIASVGQKLPQHVAETRDRSDRKTIRFAGQGRNGVEGAEDEARAIDEEEVIAFFHGAKG